VQKVPHGFTSSGCLAGTVPCRVAGDPTAQRSRLHAYAGMAPSSASSAARSTRRTAAS